MVLGLPLTKYCTVHQRDSAHLAPGASFAHLRPLPSTHRPRLKTLAMVHRPLIRCFAGTSSSAKYSASLSADSSASPRSPLMNRDSAACEMPVACAMR